VTVVVGVTPQPLMRVLEHLFRKYPEIHIVGRPRDIDRIKRQAGLLSPDMIVLHQRLLGKEARETIAAVKRSSPGSKLILIRSDEVRGGPRYGADAHVAEEAIVRRLPDIVARLAEQKGNRGLRERQDRCGKGLGAAPTLTTTH